MRLYSPKLGLQAAEKFCVSILFPWQHSGTKFPSLFSHHRTVALWSVMKKKPLILKPHHAEGEGPTSGDHWVTSVAAYPSSDLIASGKIMRQLHKHDLILRSSYYTKTKFISTTKPSLYDNKTKFIWQQNHVYSTPKSHVYNTKAKFMWHQNQVYVTPKPEFIRQQSQVYVTTMETSYNILPSYYHKVDFADKALPHLVCVHHTWGGLANS